MTVTCTSGSLENQKDLDWVLWFQWTLWLVLNFLVWEGVKSSFWIHVSQTREGFNLPLRLSYRRGSNSTQARNRGNESPSLVWLTLDPCLSDGLSGGFNPPHLYGWHESKNWIVPCLSSFHALWQKKLNYARIDLINELFFHFPLWIDKGKPFNDTLWEETSGSGYGKDSQRDQM